MTTNCKQSRRRDQEIDEGQQGGDGTTASTTITEEDSCCSTCDFAASAGPARIVTSSHIAPTLQSYVTIFNKLNSDENSSKKITPTPIRLSVLSSFQELQAETVYDVKLQSALYDGFVVPPMMLGGIYEHQGLASMEYLRSTPYWNDFLPYYRNHIAVLDGTIRSVPLFAGNQMLLLFRKDYLDARNMPTPKTYSDFARVAAELHNQPLGVGGERIYGACLGRMSEQACRKKKDTTGRTCRSLSTTYLGMALSSMTQTHGNSTGWLFDSDTSKGMKPLLNGTLEEALLMMEELMQYGAPNELQSDSSMNIDFFEQGRCAMTVAADHPPDLLRDENVGFVALPGANRVLDRITSELVECTKLSCPYGTRYFNNDLGTINRVPFGAHDLVVGGISSFASENNQELIKDFFEFVLTTRLNISVREQPMTYSGLQSYNVEGYYELMEELTSSDNVATPFRVPGSFSLLNDLDTRVYDYLKTGNFSSLGRSRLRKSVEDSWSRQIRIRDNQFGVVPTAIFYEKSLGIFIREPPSDLYIGTMARYIGWGFGALGCLFSLYCAFWVWTYQERRIVKSSQPIFLWLICFGTFVMSACIFFFGVEDDLAPQRITDVACMASIWLYSVGYVVIFCALFSKIWRVNQIFRNTSNSHRIKVEPVDVLLPFSILFGMNFVVLLYWTITDPVKWIRVPIEDPATDLGLAYESTFGACDSENYRLFLGIIIGVNIMVSLTALIQAYECRRISTEYSEILWISGALCTVVQVWLIGLPVLKLLGDNPFWTFVAKTALAFITSFATLAFLFIPKLKYLRDTMEEELKFQSLGPTVSPRHRKSEMDDNDHTDGSHEPDGDWQGAGGGSKPSGLEPPSSTNPLPPKRSSGVVGIRIIQSVSRHSEEVERLKSSIKKAEKRNKVLQDRLERLQDQIEHYLVSHSNHGQHNIIMARPEQSRISGTTDGSYKS